MDRAYSVLETKAMREDEDFFYVEGIASTPATDRMGDIVDPMGAKFKTPMPLLWQHNHEKPVGHMTFAKPTKQGIPFQAKIPKIKEAGTLKDRVDEAIQSLQYKLVAAVSIGFNILKGGYEVMETGGWHIKSWEWLELSLVTIPANSEAVISAVKSVDQKALSALGHERNKSASEIRPGATGKKLRPIQLIPRK
jgi:HK97 family phage prohead protease